MRPKRFDSMDPQGGARMDRMNTVNSTLQHSTKSICSCSLQFADIFLYLLSQIRTSQYSHTMGSVWSKIKSKDSTSAISSCSTVQTSQYLDQQNVFNTHGFAFKTLNRWLSGYSYLNTLCVSQERCLVKKNSTFFY